MNKKGLMLTPLSITVLLILFAVAVGTLMVNNGLELQPEEQLDIAASCNAVDALNMKLINKEISIEEYDFMRQKVGGYN